MRLAAHQLRPFTDINGRRWSHPSVSALMTLGAPSECPEAVIRRLCRELVAEARADGLTGPPYDPEVLASWKGIEVLPASHDIRADARIFPAEGRLRIEYTPDVSEERRRFSIFHEITHTRFPDCYEEARHRQHGDRFDRLHAELEQLCNVGAAEMLMPADDMASRTSGRTPSVELVEELRADFAASHSTDRDHNMIVSDYIRESDSAPAFQRQFRQPDAGVYLVDERKSGPHGRGFLVFEQSLPARTNSYSLAARRRYANA
jgi:hypothetical protein